MATTPADKKSNHISSVVQGIQTLLKTVEALRGLTLEANSLGYTTSLTDTDFVGQNAFLTAADYKNAMAALQSLDTQLNTPGANGTPSTYAILYTMKLVNNT